MTAGIAGAASTWAASAAWPPVRLAKSASTLGSELFYYNISTIELISVPCAMASFIVVMRASDSSEPLDLV